MKYRFVMLIDDNEVDNFVNSSLIHRSEFAEELITFNSAEKALKFLNAHEDEMERIPDIIFLDIRMPGMDGFGFLKEFETLSSLVKQKCKIIMLTSSLDIIDYKMAIANPYVFNFLKKPLNIEELKHINVYCE